jgi:general secretion pathway protein J
MMARTSPTLARRRGFTLIELLVAISILAVVAVLGWRGLDGIMRSRETLTRQLEESRGIQLAFAQMQSDLEHVASATMLHDNASLDAASDRLTIIRTVYADNEATRLQIVAYRIQNGVLTRRESVATRDLTQLNTQWTATLSDSDGAATVALQNNVGNMSIRLWESMNWRDAASGGNSSSTVAANQTSSTTTTSISLGSGSPTGLEISMQVGSLATPLIKVFLLGAV